jgi:hypothetical protein
MLVTGIQSQAVMTKIAREAKHDAGFGKSWEERPAWKSARRAPLVHPVAAVADVAST